MTEKNRGKMGKILACTAAVIMAMSMAGCANSDDSSEEKEEKTEAVTTTTAAEAETEAPTETEPEETEAEADSTQAENESSAAVTSAPSDLDAELDSMIASAEALISDIDKNFGFSSSSSGAASADSDTDTSTAATTTTAATTAAPAAPSAGTADISSEQQFVFDGVKYDNTTFTGAGITLPSGWTTDPSSASGKQKINSAYEQCYIVEGQSSGASFMISDAKRNGKTSLPPLELYKGLTWGASAADIKAAFGAPAKESRKEMYGTSMTNLFYSSSDGSLIVYEVSDDWGLIVVDGFGK